MDQITDVNTIDAISLAAISSFVQASLIEKPRLMGTVSDLSSLVGPGMKSLAVPRFGNLNVQKKQASTKLVAQKLTPTNDTILLVEHDAILVEVEDIAQLQSSVDMQQLYGVRIAEAMAKQTDKEIYMELLNASASSPDHRLAYASGSAISKGDFNKARRLFRESEVDIDDGSLFAIVTPANEEAILNSADFVDVDKFGSEAERLKSTGVVGRLFGFYIIPRAIALADKNVLYHKSAMAIARQMGMQMRSQYDIYNQANLISGAQLYGQKIMQAGKASVLIGSAS